MQQGKPFVGPSGQLLDAVFDHIGIDSSEVYKTNAVLCRPPDNKLDRYPGAVTACNKRLQAELATLECDTIVALGNSAAQALDMIQYPDNHTPFKNVGILARRGTWYKYYAYDGNEPYDSIDPNICKKYLATLHPAFILRQSGYTSQWLQDMRSILLEPNIDWYHITPVVLSDDTRDSFILELSHWYAEQRMVAFDVETPNLVDKRLLALGLTAYDDEAWIVPGDYLANDESIREILNHFLQGAKLVAHNGKFDQQVLLANGFEYFTISDDTMLMHHCLDEQKGTHGLKQVASSYLGVHDYEAELIDTHFRNQKRDERDYSTIPTDKLYDYLAIDCCATLALYKLFSSMIDADNVRQAYAINVNAANALVKTEAWGIKIDRPYLEKLLKHLEDAIEAAKLKVTNDAIAYAVPYLTQFHSNYARWHNPCERWIKGTKKNSPQQQYQIVLEKIATGVSLGSWQQTQCPLSDVLGLKHVKKLGWKTDPRSTNAEALDALEDHPFVRVLQEYRKLDKIHGTYVVKLLAIADKEDRVHVRYNLQGTETDRMSANDGLHGIPRPTDIWGQALRGSFIAERGVKIGKCDYAQAELRVFAALSGERFLLDMFANREDPHGNITLMVFGNDPRFIGMTKESYNKDTEKWTLPQLDGYTDKDQAAYWKEKRTTGKNVVFGGLVYQGKAPGIVAMIRAQTGKDVDTAVVDHVLTSMLANMPNAAQWQRDQFRFARERGYVQTRLGFKRRFMVITEENLEDVKKACVNAPVQGVVAQLLKISGTQLTNQGVRILMYNHDELVFEMPESEAEATAKLVQQTMIDVAAKYFPEVAWRADVEIGDRWFDNRPEF